MALLFNRFINQALPGKLSLTNVNSVLKVKTLSQHLNSFGGQASLNNKTSIPNGYNVDGAFFPSIKPGELVSHSHNEGIGVASNPILAMGIPLDGDATGSSTVSQPVLQLIVGLSGTAAGSCTVSNATLGGVVQLSGDATGSCSFSADLGAIVNMSGTAQGGCSFSANLTGLAFMSGESTPYTELSPQNLAANVWSYETRELTAASSSSLTTEEHTQLMKALTKAQFIALK